MNKDVFQKIGEKVERLWKEENYNEEKFSDIAASVIEETNICGFDIWEINRWIHKSESLPAQHDQGVNFSDMPVTVFNAERFYIDIYFWLNSTTAIHQHSFAGAFQVLHGSSIHSLYTFEDEEIIDSHLMLGKIKFHSFDLLETGAICKIHPGNRFIHSLFHLDRPSVTLTVRTYALSSAMPQFDYRKPSLAVDPFYKPDVIRKKKESVSLLLQINHPEAQTLISELLEDADLLTTYSILKVVAKEYCNHPFEKLFNLTKSRDKFDQLVSVARIKHGNRIDMLIPVFEEEIRQREIVKRRSQINKPEHRFLMALLLNLSGREKIFRAVKQRFPDSNPIDLIVNWVKELSMIKTIGSHEPNVLNLSDVNAGKLFIFESMLKGMMPEEIKCEAETDIVSVCN